jgi:hypothetical protein
MSRRFALVLLASLAATSSFHAQDLTEKNYDSTKQQIIPGADEEKWREIDWQPTYWDGVTAAQKADKPVMLFTMNGHPFGCT